MSNPKMTPHYLAVLAIDNGECAAQIEIKDKSLRESLILNVETQMKRLVAAQPPGTEPEIQGVDGTVRKAHYGDGRQPWDDMLDFGWGPHFAAGSALKYIRRYKNKNGADDLKKGRWYYGELVKRAAGEINGPWSQDLFTLEDELTQEERSLLRSQE